MSEHGCGWAWLWLGVAVAGHGCGWVAVAGHDCGWVWLWLGMAVVDVDVVWGMAVRQSMAILARVAATWHGCRLAAAMAEFGLAVAVEFGLKQFRRLALF